MNVGTSAETGPTVPKDTAAADRRTVVVRATNGVAIRAAARTAPAVRVRDRGVAPVSGGNATTAVATTGATIAEVKSGATTGAANVVGTTGVNSPAAVTIVAVPVVRLDVAAAKAASDRLAAERLSARSAVTPARTSRTSPMRSRPASSIRRFAAIC
ncbi:hypothetical protein GCM10027068_27620 [Prescottella soli]